MNFYLIGSLEGFNDLRFPNVEDWQNCMGHAEGLLKQWNPPEMEYIWKKSGKNGADCYSKNGHAVTVLTRQS
ncbi:hypothetical protein NXW26_25790 [Bacteroides faecis]|nr:hypothetical protein [Bacteroides faecis]UVR64798.1 hypothetical protein NXW26_25790 [Bacteroides faecis]